MKKMTLITLTGLALTMIFASNALAGAAPPVPDAGSTALLLAISMVGLTRVRKYLR